MKLHISLSMAWASCALCSLPAPVPLSGAGETFDLGLYNAEEYAEEGKQAEYVGVINYLMKKAIPSKTVRRNILSEISMVSGGDLKAEETLALLAEYGVNGMKPDAPAGIGRIVEIAEKNIPNPVMRNKLYNSLTNIKLGDMTGKDVVPVVNMLNEIS